MNIQDVLEDRVVADNIDLPVDEVVRQFGRMAIKHLGIPRPPKLRLINSKDSENSFGHYDPPTDTITLVVGDRHIMDILRTLAHELTHCRQFQDQEVPLEAGETGSPWENEANAEAGVIMRNFQNKYPEFFKSRVVAESKINEIGFAHELGDLKADAKDVIAGANKDGEFNQTVVWRFSKGNSNLFFLKDGKQILSLVLLDGQNLKAIKNFSTTKGAVLAIINYLVNIKGMSINISADEPLTPEGLKWVIGLANSKSGVTVKNSDGSDVDTKALTAEWGKSKASNGTWTGPTDLVIRESSVQWKKRLAENEHRLMPFKFFDVGTIKKPIKEASGYIPTKKQAKDPRFSTALTVDIHPGQTGKEANKLALKTDSQGQPALLQPNAGNIMKTTRSKFTESERAIMEGGHELPVKSRPTMSFLQELKIDNANGIAAVPNNQEVDYFGMRVEMKPSMFINLSLPLNMNQDDKNTIEHLKAQLDTKGIGAPFLTIDYPAEWDDGDFSKPAAVKGHDGRHRMYAIIDKEGDAPVEVHLFFNGGVRARDLTPEIKAELNKQIVSQRGQLVRGPWFENSISEDLQLTELADKPYPFEFVQHGAVKSAFGFTTDADSEYVVEIYPMRSGNSFQNNLLEVTFAQLKDGATIDSQTGDAGSDALRIFGTVVAATKEALAKRTGQGLNIEYIRFLAKNGEPKRVALYTRFAKNIGRYLSDWEFDGSESKGESTVFQVKRKR